MNPPMAQSPKTDGGFYTACDCCSRFILKNGRPSEQRFGEQLTPEQTQNLATVDWEKARQDQEDEVEHLCSECLMF